MTEPLLEQLPILINEKKNMYFLAKESILQDLWNSEKLPPFFASSNLFISSYTLSNNKGNSWKYKHESHL